MSAGAEGGLVQLQQDGHQQAHHAKEDTDKPPELTVHAAALLSKGLLVLAALLGNHPLNAVQVAV